jgi:drug/metabolite transporter (DMT)-like permease
VSVLVSLYPAVTVALAAAVLHERIHRGQACGLGLAAVAVALISLP